MAILNTSEIIGKFKTLCGEAMTDEQLSFLEDLSDTTTALDSGNAEELARVTAERDDIRTKYVERFGQLDGTPPKGEADDTAETDETEINTDINIEDIFD